YVLDGCHHDLLEDLPPSKPKSEIIRLKKVELCKVASMMKRHILCY
ncbi:hypothetical protein L917_17922, partial [Phytophthora nicotianae]